MKTKKSELLRKCKEQLDKFCWISILEFEDDEVKDAFDIISSSIDDLVKLEGVK